MSRKFKISLGILQNRSYIDADNLSELIDELEKRGISKFDIEDYPPYDDSTMPIKTDINVNDMTDEHFFLLTNDDRNRTFINPVKPGPYPVVSDDKKIEFDYLPFKDSQLKKYFNNPEHVKYYLKSAEKYKEWKRNTENFNSSDFREFRQIEKDERFWVAQAFMTIFEQLDKKKVIDDLIKLLIEAYGEVPPVKTFSSWPAALAHADIDVLVLNFETNIPSPTTYKNFLTKTLGKRHIIPYIIEAGRKNDKENRADLEGPTDVDALIVNKRNGLNIFIEAKVLSDISHDVTYDTFRNQIARNIDVMLSDHRETYKDPDDFRAKLNPDKSLFLLVTPLLFKNNPHSRLYGYKMEEYKNDPLQLMADLNHRTDIEPHEWKKISERLGWVTWEDIHSINRNCCKWIK